MVKTDRKDLSVLFDDDETAWLKAMAALAANGRRDELDLPHLCEYLNDMAKRDEREVFSRLVILFCHFLKWEFQPEQRSGSWRGTIREQRRELNQLLESGTLRNFAESVFAEAYEEARKQAGDETELAVDTFPVESANSLDELLNDADVP